MLQIFEIKNIYNFWWERHLDGRLRLTFGRTQLRQVVPVEGHLGSI
jgi:hypothetical protein